MTLSAEVSTRYGDDILVPLTNPNNPAATTVNATVLAAACADVQARFVLRAASVAFDLNDSNHVAIAVEGVIGFLMRRLGTFGDDATKRLKELDADLDLLAQIDQRDYVTPEGIAEAPRMPRSASKWVTPMRPNRGRTGSNDTSISADE